MRSNTSVLSFLGHALMSTLCCSQGEAWRDVFLSGARFCGTNCTMQTRGRVQSQPGFPGSVAQSQIPHPFIEPPPCQKTTRHQQCVGASTREPTSFGPAVSIWVVSRKKLCSSCSLSPFSHFGGGSNATRFVSNLPPTPPLRLSWRCVSTPRSSQEPNPCTSQQNVTS